MQGSRGARASASRRSRRNTCSCVSRLRCMGKIWVLDTETKGTGANMVPIEKVLEQPSESPSEPVRPSRKRLEAASPNEARRPRPRPHRGPEISSTPLPPGHVRKKATGEIGKVLAVDPQAGTATVRWLKRGAASTVPLSAVARR